MEVLPVRREKIYILTAATAILVSIVVYRAGITYAQPGSETDPVVSLSYLETAMSFNVVPLEGGEELRVKTGLGIILVEGSANLVLAPESRSRIVDITAGEVHDSEIEMVPGHMYFPVNLDGLVDAITIQAWQTSYIAIPGGSGR
jgi:hypothetical protein